VVACIVWCFSLKTRKAPVHAESLLNRVEQPILPEVDTCLQPQMFVGDQVCMRTTVESGNWLAGCLEEPCTFARRSLAVGRIGKKSKLLELGVSSSVYAGQRGDMEVGGPSVGH